MRRHVFARCLIAGAVAALFGLASPSARAASICVGNGSGCYASLQAAVDAAHDGDVIHIGPGVFAGGITIDASVKLLGSGAGSTVISGGGPVLTIGELGAGVEPTVTIKGVTITGGVNSSSPEAFGGGIDVPPAADGGLGATVTISDSVVTGNRAAPASAVPSGLSCGAACPYALGSGGGIDNAGVMKLTNVIVMNNHAGSSVTSDAEGGGIMNERFAALTLRNSEVSDNVARAVSPNSRFAIGGGIFTRFGSTLTADDSIVSGNAVDFSTSFPADTPGGLSVQSGGIKIGGNTTSTRVEIRGSTISGNSVAASSSGGEVSAFAGGIDDDGWLVLRDSDVSDNRVSATGVGNVYVDGGALEIETAATISNTRFTGNRVHASAPTGLAASLGGGIFTATTDAVTVSDSIVAGNVAESTTLSGSVLVQGGGILNGGLLELRSTAVTDNNAIGTGSSGVVQGGGIWNGDGFDPPFVQLSLRDSTVLRNTLSGSAALTHRGGGLFTTFPVTLVDSVIAQNAPDQCFGC